MHGIERDRERFRQIVKGKIKQNLRKYISQEDIIGKKGSDKISIPIPRINLPKFVFGDNNGGVGQGPGEGQQAGKDPADHPLEVEVSLEEMAELLGEELELPRIEPKGKSEITVESNKYRSRRRIGPESLLDFKKTYKEALLRQVALGDYDPENPSIIPIREDKRYRASVPITVPHNQALIIYMMDVSGSMGHHEKELARLTSFWIDLWLRAQYKNKLHSRYIIHDTEATEVDQHTFYRVRAGGGTRIASAYELCDSILSVEYNISDWNVYLFQYSDGDDWGGGSSQAAVDIIKKLLPNLNQVAYCQVRGERGSGDFKNVIETAFPKEPKVVSVLIDQRDQILDAIKAFFVKGQ